MRNLTLLRTKVQIYKREKENEIIFWGEGGRLDRTVMKKSRPKILETLTAMQENIVCLQSQNFPRISSAYTHTHTHKGHVTYGFSALLILETKESVCGQGKERPQRRKVGSKGEKNARERVCRAFSSRV